MRARATIVAEADGRGGTRLAVLRGESPLLLRRTGPRTGGGVVTVHLVGGAAGPGAGLDVRSVAASIALPGRPGAASSCLEIHATVAEGAALRWLPEPLIAAAGCLHRTVTTLEVAAGGEVLWRDDLVCGRHGEASGDVRTDITIRYAGTTLYRHELAVGPSAPGWSGAAILGSCHAAVGSAVFVGGELPAASLPGGDAAVMPLAGPGMLATAVGADIRQVRAALDPLCAPTSLRPSTTPTARPPWTTPAKSSPVDGDGPTLDRDGGEPYVSAVIRAV
jgi:urease accessory protein